MLQAFMGRIDSGTFKTIDVTAPEFGAVGDGVTDDTAAIQRAILYAQDNAPATVMFPRGRYVTKDLTLSGNGVTLTGAGAVLVMHPDGVTTAMLVITGNRNEVRHLEFDGNAGNVGDAGVHRCIQINGGNDNLLFDCYAHDTLGKMRFTPFSVITFADTFQIIQGRRNVMLRCRSENAGYNGIRVSGSENRILYCDVLEYKYGRGIRGTKGITGAVSSIWIVGCVVQTSSADAGSGILYDPDEGGFLDNLYIQGCYVYMNSGRSPGSNALKLAHIVNAYVDDCVFECGGTGNQDNVPLRVEDGCDRVFITNCHLFTNIASASVGGIFMNDGIYQGQITAHSDAGSPNAGKVRLTLGTGHGLVELKKLYVMNSGIPQYNRAHVVLEKDSTSVVTDVPYASGGVLDTANNYARGSCDQLYVKNTTFGNGQNLFVGMENINVRVLEVEHCRFYLGSGLTGIEWDVDNDKGFDLLRVVRNEMMISSSSASGGKLIQPENTSTMLKTSGKTICFGNSLRNLDPAGAIVTVNVTNAANRALLFNSDGDRLGCYLGTAKPTGTDVTFNRGDTIRNVLPSGNSPPGFVCVASEAVGTWKNMANLET